MTSKLTRDCYINKYRKVTGIAKRSKKPRLARSNVIAVIIISIIFIAIKNKCLF